MLMITVDPESDPFAGTVFLLLGWRSGGCLSEAFKASDRLGASDLDLFFPCPCGLLDHIRGLRPVDGRK